jgi:glycine hydroxymethyltransferase
VIANAKAIGEELTRAGVRLVAGGTDTHLLLVDLTPKNLTGKAVEAYLDEIKITVNKNAIPDDPQKPAITSGIRIGSPAITSRGFGEEEAREVGRIIGAALDDIESGENKDAPARPRRRADLPPRRAVVASAA